MKALDAISRVAMPQQIAEIARPIALRHHVNELYLFGSMARGEGRADSDIDFIYQFDGTANPMIDEWALRDDLTSTFGREIDLVKKRYNIPRCGSIGVSVLVRNRFGTSRRTSYDTQSSAARVTDDIDDEQTQ